MKPWAIVIYKSSYVDRWYWKIVASNGRTVADGAEGYKSKSNAKRAVNRLLKANFVVVDE